MESEGYLVRTAESAEAALALLAGELPQLILMDLQLPTMDGLELTRRLKSRPDTREIPIVALTANAMRGDEEAAREAGCDDFITKPVDARLLARVVGGLIA